MVFVFPMAVAMMASMAGLAGVTMGGLGYSAARDLQNQALKPNERIESAVCEVYNAYGTGFQWDSICSGTFINPTGLVLTSTRCFRTDTSPCRFNGSALQFDNSDQYYVRVHNINGIDGLSYVMRASLVAYSGLTDVLLLQVNPLSLTDGSEQTITLTHQPFAEFGDSTQLKRGTDVYSMIYADRRHLRFVQKFTVADPSMQCLFDCEGCMCVQSENVMITPWSEEGGGRGAAFFSSDNKIIAAPFTTSDWDNAATATSSNIAQRMIMRMRNEAPNGFESNFLVPSLGIMAQAVGPQLLSRIQNNFLALDFLPSKGYLFQFLAGQDWYDFIQQQPWWCNSPPLNASYMVTPPSLVDAPLDVAEIGTPPATFPGTPGIDGCFFPTCDKKKRNSQPYLPSYIIMDMEVSPGKWIAIGEDSGQYPPSTAILGSGKWVGDTIRVRIYGIVDLTNVTLNWQGIYTVTLQPVDPFFDMTYLFYFSGGGTVGRVDNREHPTKLYNNKKDLPSNYASLPTVMDAFEYFMGQRYPNIADAVNTKYQKSKIH